MSIASADLTALAIKGSQFLAEGRSRALAQLVAGVPRRHRLVGLQDVEHLLDCGPVYWIRLHALVDQLTDGLWAVLRNLQVPAP